MCRLRVPTVRVAKTVMTALAVEVRVAPAGDAADLAVVALVAAVSVVLARNEANDVRMMSVMVTVMNDVRRAAILMIDLSCGNAWKKHHRKSVVRSCSE